MQYSIDDVQKTLSAIALQLIGLEEELTQLDGKLGDGDLGVSMARGGEAMRAVAVNGAPTLGALFDQCAAAFNRAAPSTLGTLLSMSMRALGKRCAGLTAIDDAQICAFPRAMADEIALRGKARRGDKTILDALIPYADEMERAYAQSGDLRFAAARAAQAARAGAEGTAGIVARAGRARWIGERNKEYPDGGAVLCWRVAEFLAQGPPNGAIPS